MAGTNLANLPWRGLTTLSGTAINVSNGIESGIAIRHCHWAIDSVLLLIYGADALFLARVFVRCSHQTALN